MLTKCSPPTMTEERQTSCVILSTRAHHWLVAFDLICHFLPLTYVTLCHQTSCFLLNRLSSWICAVLYHLFPPSGSKAAFHWGHQGQHWWCACHGSATNHVRPSGEEGNCGVRLGMYCRTQYNESVFYIFLESAQGITAKINSQTDWNDKKWAQRDGRSGKKYCISYSISYAFSLTFCYWKTPS